MEMTQQFLISIIQLIEILQSLNNCIIAVDKTFTNFYKYIPGINDKMELILLSKMGEELSITNKKKDEIFLIDELKSEKFKKTIKSDKAVQSSHSLRTFFVPTKNKSSKIAVNLLDKLGNFPVKDWQYLGECIDNCVSVYRNYEEPYKQKGKEIEELITKIFENTANSEENTANSKLVLEIFGYYDKYRTYIDERGDGVLQSTKMFLELKIKNQHKAKILNETNEIERNKIWNKIKNFFKISKTKKEIYKIRIRIFFKTFIISISLLIIGYAVYYFAFRKDKKTIKEIFVNTETINEQEAEELFKIFEKQQNTKIWQMRHDKIIDFIKTFPIDSEPEEIINKVERFNLTF